MTPSPEVVRAALSKLSDARVTGQFGDSSARNLAAEYEQTIRDAAQYWGMGSFASSSTASVIIAHPKTDPFGQAALSNSGPLYGDVGLVGGKPPTLVNSGTGVALFQELGKSKNNALLALVSSDFQAREKLFCVTDLRIRFSDANTKPIVTPGNEVEFPWLHKTYLLVKEGLQAQALRSLYWGIEDLLAGRQFASINRVFAQVDLLKLSPEVMIGLIRSTYRARLAISSWTTLLKRISEEFERRAIPNWKNLLIGLDP